MAGWPLAFKVVGHGVTANDELVVTLRYVGGVNVRDQEIHYNAGPYMEAMAAYPLNSRHALVPQPEEAIPDREERRNR